MTTLSVPLPTIDMGYVKDLLKESMELMPKLFQRLLSGAEENIRGRERLVGLFLIVFGTHVYYWQTYSFWSRRNVKTPTPLPIFGNFLHFMTVPRQVLQLEWPKKYGKIYGYYMGGRPYLVCADAHILKRICIKDFDKFPNHFFVGVKNKYQKHFLVMQKDDHWRGMRHILTPTFTSGKIKQMFKLLDGCAEDLIKQQRARMAKSETGDVTIIDARQTMGSYSMGSALSSFYGINLNHSKKNMEEEEDDDVYTKDGFAKRSQDALRVTKFRFVVTQLVPLSILRWLNFPQTRPKPMDFFAGNARKIVDRRRQHNDSGRQFNDYLQLLLEAKAGNEMEIAESDRSEEHHALLGDSNNNSNNNNNNNNNNSNTSNGSLDSSANGSDKYAYTKMKLSETEVFCQTMMLMVVATETTATLLCNTAYLLAWFPEVQERLYQELIKIMKPKEHEDETNKFDYEQLTSCQYLDCVISESLRLMPPALAMDREASEDYYIPEYDITIPKDTTINMDYWAIHRNPEYWPEPDKFDPERFYPENKHKIIPGSYCPFGIGPRSCIGFRFALTEAKIGFAKFVTEFKIEKAEGTCYPPKPINYTSAIINEFDNLLIKIRKR